MTNQKIEQLALESMDSFETQSEIRDFYNEYRNEYDGNLIQFIYNEIGKANEILYEVEGDFVFSIDNESKSITLVNYMGNSETVTIPEKVTVIGENALRECYSIRSVIIEDGVETICRNAFDSCRSLEDISIPQSVTKIENAAFGECGLEKAILPDSITEIAPCLFYGCFDLTEVTIPYGVTSIGDFAFSNCRRLRDVKIPDGVTEIGVEAFFLCSNLWDIMIPDSVTNIDENAFHGCRSLERLTLPKNLTHMGEAAFKECSSLHEVVVPDGITEISKSAFEKCVYLRCVDLPKTINSIHPFAFRGCENLEELYISEDWSLSSTAFFGCYRLEALDSLSGFDDDVAKYPLDVSDVEEEATTNNCINVIMELMKRHPRNPKYVDDFVEKYKDKCIVDEPFSDLSDIAYICAANAEHIQYIEAHAFDNADRSPMAFNRFPHNYIDSDIRIWLCDLYNQKLSEKDYSDCRFATQQYYRAYYDVDGVRIERSNITCDSDFHQEVYEKFLQNHDMTEEKVKKECLNRAKQYSDFEAVYTLLHEIMNRSVKLERLLSDNSHIDFIDMESIKKVHLGFRSIGNLIREDDRDTQDDAETCMDNINENLNGICSVVNRYSNRNGKFFYFLTNIAISADENCKAVNNAIENIGHCINRIKSLIAADSQGYSEIMQALHDMTDYMNRLEKLLHDDFYRIIGGLRNVGAVFYLTYEGELEFDLDENEIVPSSLTDLGYELCIDGDKDGVNVSYIK